MSPLGYVYAIEAGDLVKIGFSRNPVARSRLIRTDSPMKPRIIGFARGTMEHEREAHRLFAAYRAHGEWFRHEGAVRSFTEMLPRYEAPRRRRHRHRAGMTERPQHSPRLAAWMDENDVGDGDLAASCGVSRATISRIRRGVRGPSRSLTKRIIAFTRGEIQAGDFLPEYVQ